MRNLVLLLIAFLAVVTFFQALDKADAETLIDQSPQIAIDSSLVK